MINNNIASPASLARVTGGGNGGYYSANILEYTDDDGWRKIGKMKNARNYHGTSLIEFENFKEYCK